MKTTLILIVFLMAGLSLRGQPQIAPYLSITNLSRHLTNYHPNKLFATETNIAPTMVDFYRPKEAPFRLVSFSVNISNNVLIAGTTNNIHFRLSNHSTNDILYWSLTHVYITNTTGYCYEIFPRIEAAKDGGGLMNTFNPGRGISFFPVKAKKLVEWDVPFLLDKDIPPGRYELLASQGVISLDGRYSWEIRANLLDVEVVKY